ncbi:MAG TPA: hypothetical protein VN673_05715 [Clostridia bacterium]|nr:hypothetical protein [Clostridia bacterium]
MPLQLIGPRPFEMNEQGEPKVRIGTLFPNMAALCTELPGLHAWQRLTFIDHVNAQRAAQGQPRLSPHEEEQLTLTSVDLIFEDRDVLIRPDPERMDLACAADELLQTIVSKRHIKFLSVADRRVREVIKHRGECWRLSAVPKTREAKERLVHSSLVRIHGQPIYYYNRLTGTRWLTYQQFSDLGNLDDAGLAAHLQEIADHSVHRNRIGRPEVDFFAADLRRFGVRELAGVIYDQLSHEQLRRKFEQLRDHFRSAVHEAFRKDDCSNKAWCERMLSSLFLEGNETQAEQVLSGLSPEFFMQVEWLPGGRFEEGEFLFDSVFDEAMSHPGDTDLEHLCDPRAKGIILNLLRDYGDLEYVNVGCVPESLSLDRPQKEGRRGVYLVEFASRSQPEPIRRFLRFMKWGVWEHLDEGKDLLQSIQESDAYSDYCLDRRLGCRQLGMNLVRRTLVRRLSETYCGTNSHYYGQEIRSTYFDREYLPGVATDKLPWEKYSKQGYAEKLARLLGRAAASSLIVGRSLGPRSRTPFDDGDEVMREDSDGLPLEILVADHTGAFGEYELPLAASAAGYSRPVNVRDRLVPNPVAFAEAYLEEMRAQLLHIQGDYRKRRRAFDTLFKHGSYDPAGSFAFRWDCILKRLDQTDVDEIMRVVRAQIAVLNNPRKS